MDQFRACPQTEQLGGSLGVLALHQIGLLAIEPDEPAGNLAPIRIEDGDPAEDPAAASR